jgi:hypothetical protein
MKKSSFRRYEAVSNKIGNYLDECMHLSNVTNMYSHCHPATTTKTATTPKKNLTDTPATNWNSPFANNS